MSSREAQRSFHQYINSSFHHFKTLLPLRELPRPLKEQTRQERVCVDGRMQHGCSCRFVHAFCMLCVCFVYVCVCFVYALCMFAQTPPKQNEQATSMQHEGASSATSIIYYSFLCCKIFSSSLSSSISNLYYTICILQHLA